MTEEERIEITKEYIRQFAIADKLKVSIEDSEGAKWMRQHWDLGDDAQLAEYRCLWRQVREELGYEQRGQ